MAYIITISVSTLTKKLTAICLFIYRCGYDQRGILLDTLENTDGMLGLGSRAISLPTQLASRGIISNVFGHCMTTDPSGGGYLFLGDDYIPRWGMTWVPVRNGPAE